MKSMTEDLINKLRWTMDHRIYEALGTKIPKFRRYKTRLLEKDVDLILRSSKVKQVRPRCSLRSFYVVEWAKNRRRPIFWPDINEAIDKAMLGVNLIPLKGTVRKNGLNGEWSVQFDVKAWYDQLPLAEKIQRYFAFDGKHCLTTLPMGFRPACEVAQAISLALVDFELPKGVSVDVYIDNVRFVGNKDGVVEAGQEFVKRCKFVGAVLDKEEAVPKQLDTFLGEEFDYVQKRRRLGEKTVEKVKYTKDTLLSNSLTYRQVAAIFGLLFFSAEVLALPMCFLYDVMRWFRTKMSEASDNWNSITTLPRSVREELDHWFSMIELNPWTTMFEEEDDTDADLTITVDACETGWGCMSTSAESTQYYGAPWTVADQSENFVFSSVVSEPLGAWRAICRFVPISSKKVVIHTDHLPQVWAMKRGIAKAETYNALLVKLKTYFPNTKFEFRFISGEENTVADALSRFGKIVEEDITLKKD
jgi:hypothetical protein